MSVSLLLLIGNNAFAATFIPIGEELRLGIASSEGSAAFSNLPHQVDSTGRSFVEIDDMRFGSHTADLNSADAAIGNVWTGGTVYYVFDSAVTSTNRDVWRDAAAAWSSAAALTFVEGTGVGNYIYVQNSTGNNSYVGMIGGQQIMNIYNWNYKFIVAHEIGHALGLVHEQSRSDRDSFVTILFANIQAGAENNFSKLSTTSYGTYDFDSVMHYSRTSFSSNGGNTIEPLPAYASYLNVMGQRDHLRTLDLSGMAQRYGGVVGPNLAPYKPTAWSDKLIISSATGTTEDASVFSPTDELYVDYAYINNGTAPANGTFKNTIYINGVAKQVRSRTTALNANVYSTTSDVSLGSLPAGTHTIKFKTDSGNVVTESNEGDNEYSRVITILGAAAPNLTPVTPHGWSAPVVITKQSGTTIDASSLKASDSLYLGLAFTNDGNAAVPGGTPGFNIEVLVDGVVITNISYSPVMEVGEILVVNGDLALGNLTPGMHEIKMRLDGNEVRAESNELDNEFTKTIRVRATPDLNNDNKADIIQQHLSTGVVKALFMGANGAVTGSVQPLGSTGVVKMKVVGTADLNGDGISDIVRQNATNGAVSVTYLNNSGLANGTKALFGGASQGAWKVAAILDLNGDGNDDLLFKNANNQQVKGYTLTSAGALIATVRPYGTTALTGLLIAGGADVNGDGRADILRQASNGKITASLLTGNAAVSGTAPMLGGLAPGTMKLVGTTDLNRDGIEDLVLEDPANGSLDGEIMNSTGNSVSTIAIGGGNAYGAFKVKG